MYSIKGVLIVTGFFNVSLLGNQEFFSYFTPFTATKRDQKLTSHLFTATKRDQKLTSHLFIATKRDQKLTSHLFTATKRDQKLTSHLFTATKRDQSKQKRNFQPWHSIQFIFKIKKNG